MSLELINAVKENNVNEVRKLIKNGANINNQEGDITNSELELFNNDNSLENLTPLLVAIILHEENNEPVKDYSKMIKLLLRSGADPTIILNDVKTFQNSSPLLWSIRNIVPEKTCKLILEKVIQKKKTRDEIEDYINLTENFGGYTTCCMNEVFEAQYYELGAMLYNLGGKVCRDIEYQPTPLHEVLKGIIKEQHTDSILSMIHMNHPDLYILDDEGYTPLALVCENQDEKIAENERIARKLVENGSDIRRIKDAFNTEIECSPEVEKLFQKLWYNTELKKAIYDDEYDKFKNIIDTFNNVSSPSEDILNAINNAYLLEREEMIKYLEKQPKLYNLTTNDGKTIWHIANESGNIKLIKRLPQLEKSEKREKATTTISKFMRQKSKKRSLSKKSSKGGTRRRRK